MFNDDEEQKSKREELRRKLLEGEDIVIGKKPSPFREWYDDKRKNCRFSIHIPPKSGSFHEDILWEENFLVEKLLMLTKYPQFTFLSLFGHTGWVGLLNIPLFTESNNKCEVAVFYHYVKESWRALDEIERRIRVYLITPNVEDLCARFGIETTMVRIGKEGFIVGRDDNDLTYLEKAPTKLIGYENVPFCAPLTIRRVEDLLHVFSLDKE